MRHLRLTSALLGLLGAGCGDVPPAPAPPADPTRVPPPATARVDARGERTVIAAADLARLKQVRLLPRDVPLAVGANAPAFTGLPEGKRVVLLFLRGDW